MSESDIKINSKARKILVENNIDLSPLTVRTTAGTVTIRGELKRLPSRKMHDRDIAKLLNVVETILLRTKGVKRVVFSIDSWTKKKGKWRRSEG